MKTELLRLAHRRLGLLIAYTVILCAIAWLLAGCGTLDVPPHVIQAEIEKWIEGNAEKREPTEAHADCEEFSKIPGVRGINTRPWKKTSHLIIKRGGDGILLDWLSKQWPTIEQNVGSVWVAYRLNGVWSKAWRYDQIRRGQHTRDIPLATLGHPKPNKKPYPVVPVEAGAVIVWVSGMARDEVRNVEERTAAAFMAL